MKFADCSLLIRSVLASCACLSTEAEASMKPENKQITLTQPNGGSYTRVAVYSYLLLDMLNSKSGTSRATPLGLNYNPQTSHWELLYFSSWKNEIQIQADYFTVNYIFFLVNTGSY